MLCLSNEVAIDFISICHNILDLSLKVHPANLLPHIVNSLLKDSAEIKNLSGHISTLWLWYVLGGLIFHYFAVTFISSLLGISSFLFYSFPPMWRQKTFVISQGNLMRPAKDAPKCRIYSTQSQG